MVGSESPASGDDLRLHALPRRTRPGDLVLVGRAFSAVGGAAGGLDQEVRLGVRQVQRERRCCRSSTPRRAATAATRARSTSRTRRRSTPACASSRPSAAGAATAIEGLEKQHLPRVGPSLEKVAAKVTREWATRWVMNPPSFRANTKMPNFFYLENFVERLGPADSHRGAAEDERRGPRRKRHDDQRDRRRTSSTSRGPPRFRPWRAGATRRAARSSCRSAGCFGCHVVDPDAQRDLTGTYRQFGPNLAGVGSQGVARLDLRTGSRTRRSGTPTRRCRTCACPTKTRSTSPSTSRP